MSYEVLLRVKARDNSNLKTMSDYAVLHTNDELRAKIAFDRCWDILADRRNRNRSLLHAHIKHCQRLWPAVAYMLVLKTPKGETTPLNKFFTTIGEQDVPVQYRENVYRDMRGI